MKNANYAQRALAVLLGLGLPLAAGAQAPAPKPPVAAHYVTAAEATQFLGRPAHLLRQSTRGGPSPLGTCLYSAGVGLSLQVSVQSNVGRKTLEMSKAPGAVPVPGVGTAAYWTKAGPVVGAQFDALKNGTWLHLYTGRTTTEAALEAVALKALARVH